MGLFGAVERAPGSQISASEGAGDLGHRRTAGCRERMRDAVCIDDRDAVLSEALRNHRFTAANPAGEATEKRSKRSVKAASIAIASTAASKKARARPLRQGTVQMAAVDVLDRTSTR